VLACALLLPADGRAAVTYSFDWYCSGCAKIGMGSNGREGLFSSASACQSARASLSGSLSTRGCGSRCFNPQPCVSAGQPDVPAPPPAVSAPVKIDHGPAESFSCPLDPRGAVADVPREHDDAGVVCGRHEGREFQMEVGIDRMRNRSPCGVGNDRV
jgi:hypothetical protein